MESIIISHLNALGVNRQLRISKNTAEVNSYIENHLLRKNANKPIEILVRSKASVHKNTKFKYRLCSASLPKNSIYKISNKISCVIPELMLIQLAPLLPYQKLLLIALEECSTYAINPITHQFVNNLPIRTSCEKIKNYASKYENLNPHFKGSKNLQKVLKLLEDNSASPMESRLYIKLCGNRKDGLYGCRNLEMNKPIKVSKDAAKIAGQEIITPDIICFKCKVAIEYNSAQYHENSEQGQKDCRRRDALTMDGWKVFSITPQQMYNEETFHIIAIKILKALGQNYRFKIKKFEEKRHAAFKLLE